MGHKVLLLLLLLLAIGVVCGNVLKGEVVRLRRQSPRYSFPVPAGGQLALGPGGARSDFVDSDESDEFSDGRAGPPYPPLMPYKFAFEVKDDSTTNYQNRVEFVEDGVLQGSYSLLSPDGIVRTAVYSDDGVSGFKAMSHNNVSKVCLLSPDGIVRTAVYSDDGVSGFKSGFPCNVFRVGKGYMML
nr:cuticle protein 18.6-like [Procambarus clarkii]